MLCHYNMKYLAIVQNGGEDNNLTFDADNFRSAEKHLKSQIKKGTMFEFIKLVELDTMDSKKFYIEKH